MKTELELIRDLRDTRRSLRDLVTSVRGYLLGKGRG